MLKTRRFGYDGKGQAVLRDAEDLERAWQQLGDSPLILESLRALRGRVLADRRAGARRRYAILAVDRATCTRTEFWH